MMTEQLRHGLVEGAYMAAIALIAAASTYVSGQVGGREIVAGLLIALTPILKRIYEAYQDGIRNNTGAVLSRDVSPNEPTPNQPNRRRI